MPGHGNSIAGSWLIGLLLAVIALLLAVIAGVLLVGQEDMLSGIRGFLQIALQIAVDVSVFGLVIAVFWGLLSLARYVIHEILRAFREAKARELGGAALALWASCY